MLFKELKIDISPVGQVGLRHLTCNEKITGSTPVQGIFNIFNQILKKSLHNKMDTVFVSLCDLNYYHRAKRTIQDLRTVGNWQGDLVLITIDFSLDEFAQEYRITEKSFPHVPIDELKEIWKTFPIRPMADDRHVTKLCQFNKLHVFDLYFKQWKRVVFLDAGMRVLDNVNHLLEIDCSGKIVAPDDSTPYDNGNRFETQIDFEANPGINLNEFGDIKKSNYFMNCIWMYDTSILDICNSAELIAGITKYPICLTNEMALMNLYLHFKYNLWQEMPERINDKYLYGWCELNYRERPDYHQFYFLKYPLTIHMHVDPN